MRKLLFFIIIVSLAFLFVNSKVWAIPNLGVATNEEYVVPNGEIFEDWQAYFASGSIPGGEDGGFLLGSSGSDLHIFTSITNEDIWLLAENSFSDNSLSFDGNIFADTSGQGVDQTIASYDPIYWGVNLGTVASTGWSQLSDPNDPNNPFNANGPFWVYDGTLTYSGLTEDDSGSYLFAAADWKNPSGKITGGEFSPKTSSATVPEPSTMLLLGIGLAGLAGASVKRRISKNTVVSGS